MKARKLTIALIAAGLLGCGAAAAESKPEFELSRVKTYTASANYAVLNDKPFANAALERIEKFDPWLHLFTRNSSDERLARECVDGNALCDARWERNDGIHGLRSRVDRIGSGIKGRVFGEKLAEHIEIDIDSSPEIGMRFEFN